VMMLTVDSVTGGNRERDLRTGFSIPFRLTLGGMLQFAIRPMWGINYVTHEGFKLPQLDEHDAMLKTLGYREGTLYSRIDQADLIIMPVARTMEAPHEVIRVDVLPSRRA
jgi:isopentenyl diphosphate isomerase/L-lactate dehydrogenase-like FMN-dependent dehydrogenase